MNPIRTRGRAGEHVPWRRAAAAAAALAAIAVVAGAWPAPADPAVPAGGSAPASGPRSALGTRLAEDHVPVREAADVPLVALDPAPARLRLHLAGGSPQELAGTATVRRVSGALESHAFAGGVLGLPGADSVVDVELRVPGFVAVRVAMLEGIAERGDVPVPLARAGRAVVRLADDYGAPLPGRLVEVAHDRPAPRRTHVDPLYVQQAVADDRGIATFDHLPPGDVTASVTAFAEWRESACAVTVIEGAVANAVLRVPRVDPARVAAFRVPLADLPNARVVAGLVQGFVFRGEDDVEHLLFESPPGQARCAVTGTPGASVAGRVHGPEWEDHSWFPHGAPHRQSKRIAVPVGADVAVRIAWEPQEHLGTRDEGGSPRPR